MSRTTLMAILAGGLLLTGCAPGRFEKSTTSYASSVNDLSRAMDASLEKYATEEVASRDRRLMDRGVKPSFSTACAARTVVTGPNGERLPACGLVANRSDVPEVNPVWRERIGAGDILRAFGDYAKALQELTSVESRKEIDEAATSASVALGSALTLAGEPTLGAAVAAGVKLVGFAYGEAFDARRYRQLRRAVEQGQQALPVLAGVLRNAFGDVTRARIAAANGTGRSYAAAAVPGSREYAANFAKASAEAARIEDIQRSNAAAGVDAMLKAHAALAEALKKDEGETAAVLKAMSEFAARAAATRIAIEGYRKGSGT